MRWYENLFARRQSQHETGPGTVAVRLVDQAVDQARRPNRDGVLALRRGDPLRRHLIPLVQSSIGILTSNDRNLWI
jgi:hypothetical protein